MNSSPPLTSENLLLLNNIVTEEERAQLEHLAYTFRDTGVITPNPSGPNRYRGKIYATEHCNSLVTALGERISARLGMQQYPVDPYLGYTVSLIETGGYINEHIDKYGPYLDNNMRQLRCNIMVKRENNNTYDPIISHLLVPVPLRSAWAFYASECYHGTQDISGPNPRIVFGFGWTIPKSYVLCDHAS